MIIGFIETYSEIFITIGTLGIIPAIIKIFSFRKVSDFDLILLEKKDSTYKSLYVFINNFFLALLIFLIQYYMSVNGTFDIYKIIITMFIVYYFYIKTFDSNIFYSLLKINRTYIKTFYAYKKNFGVIIKAYSKKVLNYIYILHSRKIDYIFILLFFSTLIIFGLSKESYFSLKNEDQVNEGDIKLVISFVINIIIIYINKGNRKKEYRVVNNYKTFSDILDHNDVYFHYKLKDFMIYSEKFLLNESKYIFIESMNNNSIKKLSINRLSKDEYRFIRHIKEEIINNFNKQFSDTMDMEILDKFLKLEFYYNILNDIDVLLENNNLNIFDDDDYLKLKKSMIDNINDYKKKLGIDKFW